MRVLDLFAGVGGIRLGMEAAGFQTAFANDIEPKCKDTYDLNFQTSQLTLGDIDKIKVESLPEFDWLTGGFPCQPFSVSGLRLGFEDTRGDLFFTIAHILQKRQPEGFLLENVKGLLNHDNGNTFKTIIKVLSSLGYTTHWKVLNSSDYGVPQNRERVFLVGLKDGKGYRFPEPTTTPSFKTILESDVADKYYYNDKPLYKELVNEIVRDDRIYQWRRKYVRENKQGVCPTLTANMGTGGNNVPIIKDHKGIRRLTPKECFNLQGFPSDYRLPAIADCHLYKQAGNSVSVPVIEAIAKELSPKLCS